MSQGLPGRLDSYDIPENIYIYLFFAKRLGRLIVQHTSKENNGRSEVP